jgi:dTDP-glucose 4,6-dehydratase
MAHYNTFGIPVIVTRCVNNYGRNQFEEKLIPKTIEKALRSLPVPIFDKGEQRRNWVFVNDHIKDLLYLAANGLPGEIYNIAEGYECSNNAIVKAILDYLGRSHDLIYYVPNARKGHDWRYALNYDKLRRLRPIPYTPNREYFLARLGETIDWYCAKLRNSGQQSL